MFPEETQAACAVYLPGYPRRTCDSRGDVRCVTKGDVTVSACPSCRAALAHQGFALAAGHASTAGQPQEPKAES